MLIDNTDKIKEIEDLTKNNTFNNESIFSLFYKNISKKICWNSNNIEGNTLTLEETIRLIDFDETRGNHKYQEYLDTKCLYNAMQKYLNPKEFVNIDHEWICYANYTIRGNDPKNINYLDIYRKEEVGIGDGINFSYIAPTYKDVPNLMNNFIDNIKEIKNMEISDLLKKVAINHLEFERIHPFIDGNGRVGRMILNQMLMNNNLLPIYFNNNSEYRGAFNIYNKNKDYSKMLYLICNNEFNSIQDFNKIKDQSNEYYQLNTERENNDNFEPDCSS